MKWEEAIYCLWKHLKSFHGQAMENTIADFGEPCSDCKHWTRCRGDWLSKVGDIKPRDLEFSVVHQEQR